MAERGTITEPLSDGKALRIIMVGHRVMCSPRWADALNTVNKFLEEI